MLIRHTEHLMVLMEIAAWIDVVTEKPKICIPFAELLGKIFDAFP